MSYRQLPRVAIAIACLATAGCDRLTKHAAATLLAGAPERSWLGGVVNLVYAENEGGLLSIGAELPPGARMLVFTIATGLLIAGLALSAIRGRWQGAKLLGTGLVVTGGASNWVDRLATGSVIDFLNVGVGPIRTGIFNVADVAIMTGIALLAFTTFNQDHGKGSLDRAPEP